MIRRIIVFSILFVLWLIFSGNMDGVHRTMGVISCGLVTWMSGDLMLTDRNCGAKKLLIQGWRMLCYIPWLVKEIVVANFHVLRLALGPKGMRDVRPRIIRHRTYLKSDFARFLFANSITLTPGTITIEMKGDELFIHAISETTAAGLEGPMEARIAHIFDEERPA